MNETSVELKGVLQAYLQLCQELLALGAEESRALQRDEAYPAFDFHQKRKNLLPQLDKAVPLLRHWSRAWRNCPVKGPWDEDVKSLLAAAQNLVVKILILDRENQQALLRRGLVPARHIPSAVTQRPHFVIDLYQRQAGKR